MKAMEKDNSSKRLFGFNYYPSTPSAEGLGLNVSEASNCVLVRTNLLQNENKSFLKKVLSAIDVNSENEYAIICLPHPLHWQEINEKFPNLQLFMAFGFRPHELSLQTHNELNRWIYLDDTRLIFTNEIEKMAPDPDLKMKFWNQLKSYANPNS